MRVLNLGCGNVLHDFPEAPHAKEIVGVDHSPSSQATVLHDLNLVPYPFPSDSFDLIILQDVIEHLRDVPAVMNEVYRLCRKGGTVRLRTPHYSSYYAFNDPTHLHTFGSFVFDGFTVASSNPAYSTSRFTITRRVIEFPKVWRITGVAALANRFTQRWEQLFAYVFRAENMIFEFRAEK